jgi:ankyrin repeat protein
VNDGRLDGVTPLYLASYQGHTAIASALIAVGADVDVALPEGGEEGDSGVTALFIAAHGGHAEVCALLIAAGADVEKARTHYGDTPLMMATQNGHVAVVAGLYKLKSVDPQLESAWFQPLSLYSEKLVSNFVLKFNLCRYVEDRLIAAGADVNARAFDGDTALSAALDRGVDEIARKLRAAGAT